MIKRIVKRILLKGVRRNRMRIIQYVNKYINIPWLTEEQEEKVFGELFDIILE